MRRILALSLAAALLTGCTSAPQEVTPPQEGATVAPATPSDSGATREFIVDEHGTFNTGWAMAFLPGTDHLLISERRGALQLRNQNTGQVTEVTGVPEVHAEGQAGMHDVIPGPTFEEDGMIYLSWVRPHINGAQGVVGRAYLDMEGASISTVEEIWEQTPAAGNGHLSLRLLIDATHLYVTSGDRMEMTPAQEHDTNLGSVLRLTHEGQPAPDNPWGTEQWTMGHRNALGIDTDAQGRIWVSEMGPQGGDELNLLVEGDNYGWPEVSMGVHYNDDPIPDHTDGDGFHGPAAWWVPSISPGNLLIYSGELFEGWADSALLGGLSGQKIVRVELGEPATVVDEWEMGARIRALAEAPDGAIWVLEDGPEGRLLELRPA
ncbi:MAG: PQQ-dependent sugar dehydrogenase [Corynebacterium sp.]|uniref:PQQ-dependent sugar dehydrogenase n=1 Tax=Corynebacterium sp. TaxID=1720 RepID=UPI0026DFF00D|nr:PQQ-dependent sugar dehydrogenase [Corynebacterium sp.]MDO5668620.1 PQQ-dependent sugar dehydrogenase [Corynebacterium sp.]